VVYQVGPGILIEDRHDVVDVVRHAACALEHANELGLIVRDGEGATKFVTVDVTGAASEASARTVARQIATSPLVKTAFYGADPNWGRILCAAGYSGIDLDPARLALWLTDTHGKPMIQLVEAGSPLDYDEKAAIGLMQAAEWGVRLDLGAGTAHALVWTCDLSHEYVTINGHYRT